MASDRSRFYAAMTHTTSGDRLEDLSRWPPTPSGVSYYRARYYDARRARFVAEDPVGFEGGDDNLYAYVSNNPLIHYDPLGLVTMPVPGPVRDPFGVLRGRVPHKGVDFSVPQGTCVVASDDGVVQKINSAAAGGRGGNEIIVRNVTGAISIYSHTMPLGSITKGATVREGQPIGQTDFGSGSATGPHLHYQYMPQHAADYVDPMKHHFPEANPYPRGVSCDRPPRGKCSD